jgi:hypothetical protein
VIAKINRVKLTQTPVLGFLEFFLTQKKYRKKRTFIASVNIVRLIQPPVKGFFKALIAVEPTVIASEIEKKLTQLSMIDTIESCYHNISHGNSLGKYSKAHRTHYDGPFGGFIPQ